MLPFKISIQHSTKHLIKSGDGLDNIAFCTMGWDELMFSAHVHSV